MQVIYLTTGLLANFYLVSGKSLPDKRAEWFYGPNPYNKIQNWYYVSDNDFDQLYPSSDDDDGFKSELGSPRIYNFQKRFYDKYEKLLDNHHHQFGSSSWFQKRMDPGFLDHPEWTKKSMADWHASHAKKSEGHSNIPFHQQFWGLDLHKKNSDEKETDDESDMERLESKDSTKKMVLERQN